MIEPAGGTQLPRAHDRTRTSSTRRTTWSPSANEAYTSSIWRRFPGRHLAPSAERAQYRRRRTARSRAANRRRGEVARVPRARIGPLPDFNRSIPAEFCVAEALAHRRRVDHDPEGQGRLCSPEIRPGTMAYNDARTIHGAEAAGPGGCEFLLIRRAFAVTTIVGP